MKATGMGVLILAGCLGCEDATQDRRVLCYADSTSNLEGVEIVIADDRCSWTKAELAAGISIPYEVRVTSSPIVNSWAQDDGWCERPGPSGLNTTFRIAGDSDQEYCLCDVGPCFSNTQSGALVEGVHLHTIEWNGATWHGPSDMDVPMGPAFLSGQAVLTVKARGRNPEGVQFKVSSSMILHVFE